MPTHVTDGLDRRILREVQRDCSMSAAQLAERCATTESTALRRLQRLRDRGVIRSQVALVDGALVGVGLQLFVRLRLEREDDRGIQAFIDRVAAHPNVLQLHFVTGSCDYLILLAVHGMADYDAFLQACLVHDPIVVMSDTSVVIRTVKATTALPIDEHAR